MVELLSVWYFILNHPLHFVAIYGLSANRDQSAWPTNQFGLGPQNLPHATDNQDIGPLKLEIHDVSRRKLGRKDGPAFFVQCRAHSEVIPLRTSLCNGGHARCSGVSLLASVSNVLANLMSFASINLLPTPTKGGNMSDVIPGRTKTTAR